MPMAELLFAHLIQLNSSNKKTAPLLCGTVGMGF